MTELLLLGTGAAQTDGSREPTMLALRGRQSTVLIDCGSNVVRQLQRLGVSIDTAGRLILTHAHPDHASGFLLLMEMLWLGGLRGPLPRAARRRQGGRSGGARGWSYRPANAAA